MKIPELHPTHFPKFSESYHAVHNSGTRPLSAIRYVVLHCTESETAESAASWFANPASQGSAHRVLGDWNGYQCLADNEIPWAAPPLNTSGIHIELAGFAAWPEAEWEKHLRSIQWAAYITAYYCVEFKIPVVYRGKEALIAKLPGITTHLSISQAFRLTDHTDPGLGFPMEQFIGLTQRYYNARV